MSTTDEVSIRRRSPVHTSRLESLPTEQRETLNAWLKQNLSYKEIVGRLQEKFGVKISHTALSTYYQRHYGKVAKPIAEILGTDIQGIIIGQGEVEVEVLLRLQLRQP